MKRNNKALYEKIMHNVSRIVKQTLNESFDRDFDDELISRINKLRSLYLSLSDFYDVGNTDEIVPEIGYILDTYGDYVENVLYCIYNQANIYKDIEFTLEEIYKILKDEEFNNGTEYRTILDALDEIYSIVKNWDNKFRG